MYGEDDYNLGMKLATAQHTVGMDGVLEGIHSDLDGRYVKDDETIIGLLHDGNHCTERRCICTTIRTAGEPDTRYSTTQ